MKTYRLLGHIVDQATHRGVSGARVEAWDSEGQSTDLLAFAVTDARGAFTIALDDAYLQQFFHDRTPTVSFRVFESRDGAWLRSPSKFYVWKLVHDTTGARIEVTSGGERPLGTAARSVVRGTMLTATGAPVSGVTVTASDAGVGVAPEAAELGSATTDGAGFFEIGYGPATESDASGRVRPDIVVRATDGSGAVLAESARVDQAPATLVIDLVEGGELRAPDEHERLRARVTTHAGAGFELRSATDAQIEQIARASGSELSHVAALARAEAISQDTNVSADIHYALIRKGMPEERRELLRVMPRDLRRALQSAVDDDILPRSVGDDLDAVMAGLRTAAVNMAFEVPAGATGCLGELVRTVLPVDPNAPGGSTEPARTFLDTYLAHEGPVEDFWAALPGQMSLPSSDTVGDLQIALQMGALTRSHFPLLKQLQSRRQGGTFTELRDLAKLSEQEWQSILDEQQVEGNGQAVGFPADMPGDDGAGNPDPAAQKANYARLLRRTMETAFPTAAIAGDLRRAASGDAVADFLDANLDFEIGKTRVAHYLSANPAARDAMASADPEAATRLQKIERLSKITPRYDEMKVLLDDGVHSARDVVRMGRAAFARKYEGALGEQVISAMWLAAKRTAAQATTMHAKWGPAMNPKGAYAVSDWSKSTKNGQAPEAADWASLFGDADFCDCAQCNSVYGPAAYFVDLLQFLGGTGETAGPIGTTARDILLQKRPDLAHIDLSCDNAFVPLPYVDLVNEILEHAVASKVESPAPVYPDHIATVGSAGDLLALPAVVPGEERARNVAYDAVLDAVYPFSLPFDLHAMEARVYLDHLGVPRHELMRLGGADAGVVAAERLGLSNQEAIVINGGGGTTEELWGFPAGTNLHVELTRVPVILEHAGLSYDDLVDLLDTAFVKGLGAPAISPPGVCDPDQMTLVFADPSQMDVAFRSVHRFLRIQRKMGISIRELDQAITALDGVIDIPGLAAIDRMRERFRLPVAVVASWFGELDTHTKRDRPSYYEEVFQNKAVEVWDADNALSIAAVTAASTTETVAGNKGALLAALRIGAADFDLLTDSVTSLAQIEEPAILAGAALTIDSVSTLHRITTLSRALGLSIRDFLILDKLTSKRLTSYTSGSVQRFAPADVEAFLDVAARVQRSRQKPAELLFLFTGHEPPQTSLALSEGAVKPAVEAMLGDLVKIHDKAIELRDPDGEQILALLGSALGAGTATWDKTVGILDGSRLQPAHPESMSDVDAEQFFEDTLAALFWNPGAVKAGLIGPTALAEIADRHSLAFAHRTLEIESQAFIRQALGDRLGLDAPMIRVLLDGRLTHAGANLARAFALPAPLPALPIESSSEHVDAYRHLARAATFVKRLGLRADEVEALCTPLFFDLDATGANGPALFGAWQSLVDLHDLRPFLVGGTEALRAIFDASDANGRNDAIAAAFGWPTADVAQLVASGVSFADAPSTCAALVHLRQAFSAIGRLAVSADTALAWTAAVVSSEAASSIVQTAKAKHSEAAWAEVAPTLRNAIREKQRDALVDYLLVHGPFADENALFGELYVDVEMAPCQLTSRLKQAIGSIQTFVQRALLHLETGVTLTEEAAEEWKWRKNYRVWEANRKVFLYPENWIYPELRDDKSPIFKALERDLRQKEITDAAAEEAFGKYLGSLGEVSRLEVVAMFHENDTPGVDVLHVVGRTRLEPTKHHYRTRVDGAFWTPWEPIEIDVEGDHLLLAVWNGRPRLFWPLLAEKADKDQKIPDKDMPGKAASMHLEIRLAHSEHQNGKWSARRVSRGEPVTVSPIVPRYALSLLLENSDDSFAVTCCANITAWAQGYNSLRLRVGQFSFDPCSGAMIASSRRSTLEASTLPDGPGDRIHLLRPIMGDGFYQYQQYYGGLQNQPLTLPIDNGNGTPSVDVFGRGAGRYRVLLPHLGRPGTKIDTFSEADVLFYEDGGPPLFGELLTTTGGAWTKGSAIQPSMSPSTYDTELPGFAERRYRFWTFHHPFSCAFIEALHRDGVPGLLRWPTDPKRTSIQFEEKPSHFGIRLPNPEAVTTPHPRDDVDFSPDGAYSLYNWEVFFHVPFLVATRLMENQRFEEAQKWFHYVFDPTSGGTGKAPQRFWRFKPFFENHDLATIQDQLTLLAQDPTASVSPGAMELHDLLGMALDSFGRQQTEKQIAAWEKDPFNPHLLARMRPLAYQKAVVMKYIENLIAWGDQLFRRETLESINEATQLYILASQLLGPRPVRVRPTGAPEAKTYAEIANQTMGAFSDPLVEAEALVFSPVGPIVQVAGKAPPPDVDTLLFCVPENDMLLGLWDTVADRLFKLRHCMNIEGAERRLPLFEPPIDPALLVRAAAAGVDIATALDEVNPLLPHYRFSVVHQKAMELASGVAALGGAFLSALEKKDAEALSRLRSDQEISMLAAVREVKKEQIREANESLKGLQKSQEVATTRRDYYAGVTKINAGEYAALSAGALAGIMAGTAALMSSGSAAAHQTPEGTTGTSGMCASPVTKVSYGGRNAGGSLDAAARGIGFAAAVVRESATTMATVAGYERRWDDWKLQQRLANKEIEQIGKQIIAAEIRIAIAERDLENHDLQREHAREVGDFLRGKVSNEDLYEWMIAELSTIHFQSYKLAHDMAKRAERAFRFERALDTSNYISFGHWDGLRRGLLAGERLVHDLRRLEVAYLEQNAREHEITKHVSLGQIAPAELLTLRDTGSCSFWLDEALFDQDYPGHYLRRLKSVSLTIPAMSGPFTGVNCTLSLKENRYRKSTKDATNYPDPNAPSNTNKAPEGSDDERFRIDATRIESIVTSSAQNDGGLFEVNFRDERYLPFEGAGAISRWTLSVPRATNGFDLSAVSDVILHVRYTARDGGKAFADAVKESVLTEPVTPIARRRLVSLRAEFPDAWEHFMRPDAESTSQEIAFQLDDAMLPYVFGHDDATATKVGVYASWASREAWYSDTAPLLVTIEKDGALISPPPPPPPDPPATPPPPPTQWTLAPSEAAVGSTNLGQAMITMAPSEVAGAWVIRADSSDIAGLTDSFQAADGDFYRLGATLQDILLVVEYTQDLPEWA